jgi:hypothetical protein
VTMGRGAAAFGPGLAEDLIASRRGAIGEDRDLLAGHLERLQAVLGCNYHWSSEHYLSPSGRYQDIITR